MKIAIIDDDFGRFERIAIALGIFRNDVESTDFIHVSEEGGHPEAIEELQKMINIDNHYHFACDPKEIAKMAMEADVIFIDHIFYTYFNGGDVARLLSGKRLVSISSDFVKYTKEHAFINCDVAENLKKVLDKTNP